VTEPERQRVLLVNGPARQNFSYLMPDLPEGIADPPEFLSLEKPAERGGKLTVDSPRLISELYRLFRDRAGDPAIDEGHLVYTHIPDADRDEVAEEELEQLRTWCTHPNVIVTKRETAEGWAPGIRYCHTCKQNLEES
jgi:hypothetical protein